MNRKDSVRELKRRKDFLEKRISERKSNQQGTLGEESELEALNFVLKTFDETPSSSDETIRQALQRYEITVVAKQNLRFDELAADMSLLQGFGQIGTGHEQCKARLIVNFINNRLQE